MAEKQDELLDHEYDGIREYDNPLPRWWLWLFYITIAFAVVYTPYYLLGYGPTSGEMYAEEVALANAGRSATAMNAMPQVAMPQGAMPHGEPGHGHAGTLPQGAPVLAGDPAAIAAGKQHYMGFCLPCHGDKGQGGIGPNLTDNSWLHGNTYEDVVNVITNGVPDKGMIAWKFTLKPQKIYESAAYVLSLQGTNPPGAKPPQGKAYP